MRQLSEFLDVYYPESNLAVPSQSHGSQVIYIRVAHSSAEELLHFPGCGTWPQGVAAGFDES